MLIAYLPGSSLSRGKVYWPCALLTTQVVMVDPTFFAPTITPSIAPSACEVTLPVSAEGDEISAPRPVKARPSKVAPTAVHTGSIALLMPNLPFFQIVSNRDFPCSLGYALQCVVATLFGTAGTAS